jgi:enoyl-CoA hydratase
MTQATFIHVQDQGAVRIITLARPEKANALTKDMLLDLLAAFDAPHARLMILTGIGKVFSAGADLDQARLGLAKDPIWDQLSARIAALPFLTIAALNGTVAGGAMGMVLACDLRITVESAKFFYPVMRLGYLPQPSDPMRLTALIGPARTKMLLMAGEKIDANQALAWGLIDKIVPEDALQSTAFALAGDLLAATSAHGSAIKSMITVATEQPSLT